MTARKKDRSFKYPKGILTELYDPEAPNAGRRFQAITAALANLYGITGPFGGDEFWRRLAMHLMWRHVPALKVRAKGGRPRERSKYFKFAVRFEMTRAELKEKLKLKRAVIDARVIEAIAREDRQTEANIRRKWTHARKATEASPSNDGGSDFDLFLGLTDGRKPH